MKYAEMLEKSIELDEQLVKSESIKSALAEKIKSADEKGISELEKQVSTIEKEFSELQKEKAEIQEKIKAYDNAVDSIIENKNMKKGVDNVNYLKTKQSVADFASLLLETGGGENLKKAWNDHLKQKGILNDDILIPEPIIQSMEDVFEEAGSIVAFANRTGLKSFKAVFNDVSNSDLRGRARGHKKGKVKTEQEIDLSAKTVTAQFIFKYITIDKETIKANEGSPVSIINYIMSELPMRIMHEIERAIVVGDGRLLTDDEHIASYEAIVEAGTRFTVQRDETGDLYEDLIRLNGDIKAQGARGLVIGRQMETDLRLLRDDNNALLLPVGMNIAQMMGYSQVFVRDFMDEPDMPRAVEFVGDAYTIVGDNTIESFEDFSLSLNKNEYLMEIYSGGALTKLHSAAVLNPVEAP